jgi:hypothetical protein
MTRGSEAVNARGIGEFIARCLGTPAADPDVLDITAGLCRAVAAKFTALAEALRQRDAALAEVADASAGAAAAVTRLERARSDADAVAGLAARARAVLLRTMPGARLDQPDEALVFRAARLDMALHNRRIGALGRVSDAALTGEAAAIRLTEARQVLAAAQAAVDAAAIPALGWG